LITVEENTLAGGFGSAVMELLASSGINDIKIENIALPDRFIEHGSQELLRSMCGVDAEGIARRIKDICTDSSLDNVNKLNEKLMS
jgi:1-deoxy-D-xylulose-5-phosphate synthase